jgi:hypothetical protein
MMYRQHIPCVLSLLMALGCTRDPRPTNTHTDPAAASASPNTYGMPNMPEPQVNPACVAQLRSILLDGELSQYDGLASGCRLVDIEAVLGREGTVGEGTLSGQRRRWLKFPLPAWHTEARAWLGAEVHGSAEVVLLDVKNPRMKTSPEALQARLGEPAAIMRARLDARNAEWLYPSHGLTVAVGKYDDPEGAKDRIIYLFLFEPTTLDRYVNELGGRDEWVRRWPQRR